MVNTSNSFLVWKLLHLQAPNIKGWQGTLHEGRITHFCAFFSDLPYFCSIFTALGQGEDAGGWSGPLQAFLPYQRAMLCGQTAGKSCCHADPAITPFNGSWDDISDRDHLHTHESASYLSSCHCRLEIVLVQIQRPLPKSSAQGID